jgi:voltage-gated potassium channel
LLVAIGFLITVAWPDIIDPPDDLRQIQEEVEWVICALFALELAINTYLARDRKRYLLTHWPDVVTVAVPFLRPVRVLRVLVVGARFWGDTRVILREQTLSLLAAASVSAVGCRLHRDNRGHRHPVGIWNVETPRDGRS